MLSHFDGHPVEAGLRSGSGPRGGVYRLPPSSLGATTIVRPTKGRPTMRFRVTHSPYPACFACLVALLALTISGCGSNGSGTGQEVTNLQATVESLQSAQAAATPSVQSEVTQMPAPTEPLPSPTPDAKAAAATIALDEVLALQGNGLRVLGDMRIMIVYPLAGSAHDVATALSDMLATCTKQDPSGFLPYPMVHASEREIDLWPPPFNNLWIQLGIACAGVEAYQKNETSANWTYTVFGMKVVDQPKLSAALAAIPDYSVAQLKRAIQDRQ